MQYTIKITIQENNNNNIEESEFEVDKYTLDACLKILKEYTKKELKEMYMIRRLKKNKVTYKDIMANKNNKESE